jgi:uncharacterized phage-associated protein
LLFLSGDFVAIMGEIWYNKHVELLNIIMIKAKVIAHYLVSHFSHIRTNSMEGDLTNLKLQKLLYYIQVLSLKRTGKPLFNDKIEAWDYGAVVPEIYYQYQSFGKHILDTDRPNLMLEPLEVKMIIDDVVADKGRFAGIALMEMIHKENPWKITRTQKDKIITTELILLDIHNQRC